MFGGAPWFENDDMFRPLLDLPPGTHTYNSPMGIGNPRDAWFVYLSQTCLLLDKITSVPGLAAKLGPLPEAERGAAVPAEAKKLFPQLANKDDFVPCIFMHGLLDDVVRPHETYHMSKVLSGAGVENEIVLIEGVGHAYDNGVQRSTEFKGLERVVPFLAKFV